MSVSTERPLPEPDSPEICALLPLESVRKLYGFLYVRQDSPPATEEIHSFLADQFGQSQSEAMRRLRSLRDCFVVHRYRDGRLHRYALKGWKPLPADGMRQSIKGPVRARVLAPQRCAQCGATPLDDGVKLVVDHKIPVAWGGGNELENLQPLCEQCNAEKRDFYATYDPYAEQIRAAVQQDEPHGRIGELLKALEGHWVPAELIGVVASMSQYQDDWQRRLRELRNLGWAYENRVLRPKGGRSISEYRLTHWEPWPAGPIAAAAKHKQSKPEPE